MVTLRHSWLQLNINFLPTFALYPCYSGAKADHYNDDDYYHYDDYEHDRRHVHRGQYDVLLVDDRNA